MSTVIQLGSHFSEISAIKRLIVFGASFCAVGYNPDLHTPSAEKPLGIEFPGAPALWQEPMTPNWVGRLISKYLAASEPILVYDFAVGGDTAMGVKRQVELMTEKLLKPEAPWTAENSLFTTWAGINDCSRIAVLSQYMRSSRMSLHMDMLFESQEQLYQNGAQNFLLINVPPLDRAPIRPKKSHKWRNVYLDWNTELNNRAQRFAADHPGISVFLFSAYDLFTNVLDEPSAYGFSKEDASMVNGGIWYDNLHPTAKMHDLLANKIAKFLDGIHK